MRKPISTVLGFLGLGKVPQLALIWEPWSARLLVAQIYDHQSNLAQCGIPIMVIDAWEHGYYLQHENRKTEFIEKLWNVWNWSDIAERFDAVRRTEVGLTGATDTSKGGAHE